MKKILMLVVALMAFGCAEEPLEITLTNEVTGHGFDEESSRVTCSFTLLLEATGSSSHQAMILGGEVVEFKAPTDLPVALSADKALDWFGQDRISGGQKLEAHRRRFVVEGAPWEQIYYFRLQLPDSTRISRNTFVYCDPQ